MSEERLLFALSQVDGQFITESAPGQIPPKKIPWIKLASLAACLCILLGILFPHGFRFQRISYDAPTLGNDPIPYINDQTVIINNTNKEFPRFLPKYAISERPISWFQVLKMEEQLGITNWYFKRHDGNMLNGLLASYADSDRGYFCTLNMSEEELEAQSWETFQQIPFLSGEYDYLGISGEMTIWSKDEGERITSVTVSFRKMIDGYRIMGNEICKFSYDASGLLDILIQTYNYTPVGIMKLLPLETALEKIRTADVFTIKKAGGDIKELKIERINLVMVNQYETGCKILQPLYVFSGTAQFEDGTESDFSARVVAVPESYTYEKSESN